MKEKYAYIRVSTREQNEARQLAAIKDLDILEDHIYMDKESGRNFDRPNWTKLKQELTDGDILYVKSIDRLGRNYTEILEEWRQVTKIIRADVVVLDMPLLDTRNGKDLTGTFISDLVLQILSYVAENEYRNIHQRQMEGIREAKARGIKFGRPLTTPTEEFRKNVNRWRNGELSLREAAMASGMSLSTFYRKAKDSKMCTFREMDKVLGNSVQKGDSFRKQGQR